MNASAHSSIGRFLVSIPHTESCAVTTYKEDCYDVSMELNLICAWVQVH